MARSSSPAEERLARAVADVAHAAGKRLVVHATELATAKAALRAGADILPRRGLADPLLIAVEVEPERGRSGRRPEPGARSSRSIPLLSSGSATGRPRPRRDEVLG